ncbi:MAG TPA: hypothetical protein VHA37_10295 [Candidatus Saccharimonadales bacterium]|nr:hypothetical protein [Candidatus Saccharimonadales bacterium]
MRRFVLSLLLAVTCLMAAPLAANAGFNPFSNACNGVSNSGDAVACKTDTSTDSVAAGGPKELIMRITDIIAYVAGALAVILIIVGSIRFITAGSDVSTGSRTDTDVEDARRTIASALIGLAVIVLARTIIFYVIKRL